MFVMASNIEIGKFKNIKPSAVSWKCSVSNFRDECTIKLPLKSYLKSNFPRTQTGELAVEVANIVNTGQTVFTEGDAVTVNLGYGNDLFQQFKGFIKQINYTTPLELVCEGYSYKLRDTYFNKSYKNATVKGILTDLLKDTGISISEYTQDATLGKAPFPNWEKIKVLEWLEKECRMSVYFDFDKLYVGKSKFGLKKATQKLKLGWNTVEDKELKKDGTQTDVQINLVEKNSQGKVVRTKSEQSKYDNIKDIKIRAGLDDATKKALANEFQLLLNFKGYQGDVTCFLIPHFEKGYVATIEDDKFPDRAGNYFVETVDGSFDTGGGRQKLTLRYYGSN